MSERTKSKELRARCSPQELKMLEAVALYEGLTRTAALRIIVREAAKERGLWPPVGGDNGNQPGA